MTGAGGREITFCKYDELLSDKYQWAICECHDLGYGIRVERKDVSEMVTFECPNCGKDLRLFVRETRDEDGELIKAYIEHDIEALSHAPIGHMTSYGYCGKIGDAWQLYSTEEEYLEDLKDTYYD